MAIKAGYAIFHKQNGYLCRNQEGQLDYSHEINESTLIFDGYNEANLLCDLDETPKEIILGGRS